MEKTQKKSEILSENLKQLRGNKTQREFASELGLLQPTYSRYESGQVPSFEDLAKIAAKLHLDPPEKLLQPLHGARRVTGQSRLTRIEEAAKAGILPTGNARFETDASAVRLVPVVSFAAAGRARSYEDMANQIDERVETSCKDANSFAVILEGNSMTPEFKAGDRVVFAPNDLPRNGDPAIVKVRDGGIYFKWYFETGKNGELLKLVSENKDYDDIIVPRADVVFAYPAWETKRRNRR